MYKYFYTNDYTIVNKTQYTGTLQSVAVQDSPSYAIYLTTSDANLYKLDQNGAIVNSVVLPLQKITVGNNGFVYGTENSPGQPIHKLTENTLVDSPVSPDSTYFNSATGIKYSTSNNLIYQTDASRKWVNAFDVNLNRVVASSIDLTSFPIGPSSIALYDTGSAVLIYVGFFDGPLKVYDHSTLQLVSPTDTTNFGSPPFGMLVSESEGYLLVALTNLGTIQLWETDGTTHTNTNQAVPITLFSSMDIDQSGRLLVVSEFNKLMIFD